MAQKGEVPKVTVRSVQEGLGEKVRGNVTWNAVPELDFEVVMRRGGDLLEVNVKAKEGHRISARRLRLAPVGEMQRAIRARVEEMGRSYLRLGDEVRTWEGDQFTTRRVTKADQSWHQNQLARMQAAIMPESGDLRLAFIAEVYVSLLGEAKPTEALAKRLDVSTKTASNYLFKAREKQLLTSLGRGRAGGELTDKARRLLDGNHQAS